MATTGCWDSKHRRYIKIKLLVYIYTRNEHTVKSGSQYDAGPCVVLHHAAFSAG